MRHAKGPSIQLGSLSSSHVIATHFSGACPPNPAHSLIVPTHSQSSVAVVKAVARLVYSTVTSLCFC